MTTKQSPRSLHVPPSATPASAAASGLAKTLREAHRADPDHHLWRNGRYWWIAFTVHTPDWRVHRLRFSLRTEDRVEARLRRDRALVWYAAQDDYTLSLRVKPATRKRRARA